MTREQKIYRTFIEWAEVAWLRARRRGLDDPVVELRALDATDPGRVLIVAAERDELIRGLASQRPGAARALGAARPGSPFTVLVTTPSGAEVHHRPAPDGRPASTTHEEGAWGVGDDHGFLLIAEDDHAAGRDPNRLMPERGWGTCLATSVAEALALLDGGLRPDCVVLPMTRPDGGGAAVLRKVRDHGLPARVAICIGTATVEDLEELSALRPDLILVRPIDAGSVGEAASKACGG